MSASTGARRALQLVFFAAVLWFAGRVLAGQWTAVRTLGASLTPAWGRVAWSGLIVMASYSVLIATWRAMVHAWGARIGSADAARIWFVSNLGRYVPGKVWQIGAMGVMAQAVGVTATAAVGSALVISLVNILAGFAVVAATGGELVTLLAPERGGLPVALGALALGVLALPWVLPPMIRLAAWMTRRGIPVPMLPHRAIWIAATGCAMAWVLYGLAFRELTIGLLGSASGEAATYVAVFTLSYLIGFLTLFAPGGIGVRELSMGALLVSAGLAGEPEAALLVIASRLWLTVLEIVPGLLFLMARPRATALDQNSPR